MPVCGADFALLKFCLEHNDSPNVEYDSPLTRDPKDYEWLRKVMESLPSVEKRREQCLDIIQNDPEDVNKLDALVVLQDLVEDLDIANDLAKRGLGELTKAMLYKINEENEENDNKIAESIRATACWVLSTITQNNPLSQAQFAEQGILPILITLLEDSNSAKVTQKALGVVSAMTRDCEQGQAFFAQNRERLVSIINKHVTSDDEILVTKSCLVLRHLCHAKDSIRITAVKNGSVSHLTKLMENSSSEQIREMAIFALEEIAPRIEDKKAVEEVSTE